MKTRFNTVTLNLIPTAGMPLYWLPTRRVCGINYGSGQGLQM